MKRVFRLEWLIIAIIQLFELLPDIVLLDPPTLIHSFDIKQVTI